jgi:predicted kinase
VTTEKRSHKERLTKLREVFGKRKEIARQSGKKHDVSIAKICKDAGIDKTYLFGHRLKDDSPEKQDYLAIKAEIIEFQKNIGFGLEKSEEQKEIVILKAKYEALLSGVEPLQRQLAQFKTEASTTLGRIDKQGDLLTNLLARNSQLQAQLDNAPKATNITERTSARVQKNVVCPDDFRIVGGKYSKGNQSTENEAWARAYRKLELLLGRDLKMRLYILVGLPCSGKSTWVNESTLASDRHPVIFDATNLSSIERFRLITTISRFSDLPKTCVFFDTDMEVIRERNRTLRSTIEKRMTDVDLTLMNSRLERPDIYEETWIDELMVIRYRLDA